MKTNTPFDHQNLRQAEAILLGHGIAREYFQGELYDDAGKRLHEIRFAGHDGETITLDERISGRLFMIPDGSSIWAHKITDKLQTPAGLEVQFNHIFTAEGLANSVIAYRDARGPSNWLDTLYIRRLMLSNAAPERLATVAFGLMAVTAYRHGFKHINLFAAGAGPLQRNNTAAFVGYDVWPKFGFDAAITPVELNTVPLVAVANCRSVQDILAINPGWWSTHGTGRAMQFDLAAGSRCWTILLNYLYKSLVGDQP